MKTPEELGLYDGQQPDATVDGMVEDPANPGWAEVSFSDGRTATLPVETAKSMPQTAPVDPNAVVYGGDAANFGAPPPAVPPEGGPNALAQQWEAAGQDPLVQAAEAGIAGPGYQAPVGRPTNPALGTAGLPGGASVTGAPQHNPMADIVAPGSAGGEAPYSSSQSQSSTTTSTVDDPAVMQDRLSAAGDAEAGAQLATDQAAYDAKQKAFDTAEAGYAAQEAQLKQQKRQAEIEVAEHQRFVKAVEDNPIKDDDFWNEGPGRKGAAWIALALSGFLQGATRGQNPALNQMVQALDHAQDRWMQNQQKSRDGVLARRERAMGNKQNAIDSASMQLSGIMSKKIDLEAQRAGLPAPPGLETYKAKMGMKAAEAQNAIGSRVRDQATIQSQQEARAVAPTGPVRRGDVVLQQLGLDKATVQKAFDPKDGNLSGAVEAADRLSGINKELQAIKAKYDDLPQQNRFSWSGVGAAGVAARLGSDAAKDQVRATALLKEASLMLKQSSGNTKLFDSNAEREDLQAQLDTGEPETTMQAIDMLTQRANTNAVGTASRYTQDPQALIDYARTVKAGTQGVNAGAQPAIKARTGYTAPGAATTPADTGGAPAQSAPLGPAPTLPAAASGSNPQPTTPAHPTARALATSTTDSPQGIYRLRRASKLAAPR